jgi:hypothetical protein
MGRCGASTEKTSDRDDKKKESDVEEVMPLLTPYQLGPFHLSHRFVFFFVFTILTLNPKS